MQIAAAYLHKLVGPERHSPIAGIVIAVYVWYTTNQREAILGSTFIANLQSVTLISDICALALCYGTTQIHLATIDVPRNVVLVDIGQSDYTVAVVTFFKDWMIIKSVAFNPNLGGS